MYESQIKEFVNFTRLIYQNENEVTLHRPIFDKNDFSILKNTIDSNLNYEHFLNITRIANLIPGKEATLKDYFKDYCKNNDPKELKNLD